MDYLNDSVIGTNGQPMLRFSIFTLKNLSQSVSNEQSNFGLTEILTPVEPRIESRIEPSLSNAQV
ncbi:MAG: hypothetical protein HC781_04265 [Leptolyngbyaceae cyanobacterium CSU_1_4]|nr:hypothetical protein [Leptolyngbyaceae cyanobacterium CSU_1_4]